MRERLILVTTASCALVTLLAIRNGVLDAGAAAVLVASLLMFVRAAFRIVEEIDQRDDEPPSRAGRTR
jgi:hypothetical protein